MIYKVLYIQPVVGCLGILNHLPSSETRSVEAAMASGASMHQASLCVGEVPWGPMGEVGDTPESPRITPLKFNMEHNHGGFGR